MLEFALCLKPQYRFPDHIVSSGLPFLSYKFCNKTGENAISNKQIRNRNYATNFSLTTD